MFRGGIGPPPHHRGRFDEEESLGKVYDNRVVARLPRYLAPVKGWLIAWIMPLPARA